MLLGLIKIYCFLGPNQDILLVVFNAPFVILGSLLTTLDLD